MNRRPWGYFAVAAMLATGVAMAPGQGLRAGEQAGGVPVLGTRDSARPENKLIAELLRVEDPDIETIVGNYPGIPERTAKQIRDAAKKKNADEALMALYSELNRKEMIAAEPVFTRALDRLTAQEYLYRRELLKELVDAVGALPRNAGKKECEKFWRELVYGSLEDPFRVAALQIERRKFDRERGMDRERGIERYLSLKREELGKAIEFRETPSRRERERRKANAAK